jgi:hypothetical protein
VAQTQGRLIRLALGVALAAALPRPAEALEPRFDHRDERGLVADVALTRDNVSVGTGLSFPSFAPALRVAYSFDADGAGDEVQLGLVSRLHGWLLEGELASLGADARWRGFFGTEELKTFFELGARGIVYPRLAGGPRAAFGIAYDPNRAYGFFASIGFFAAFGKMTVVSAEIGAGIQLRFE